MANIEELEFKAISGPVTALRRQLGNDTSRRALRMADEQRQRMQMVAIECTTLLLGSFRKCDADDPELYSRCIEHELARYDPEIQREVCDPGRWDWPPKVSEIRKASEKIANERSRVAKREAELVAQFAERRRLDALEAERKALPAPAKTLLRPPDGEHFRRAFDDLVWRKVRREPPAPTVFEFDPATWND
jgi:hypothetical protein